ncbi:MAG: MFS transporter [Candidatus Thermoplasmatota archaeon]|jgi:MFS family permease|uniref:MFS transporter n=1 Tax=Ferroplasma sp. TaxID=2591003 RepID=UPI00260DA3AE|nr:MFS transporter [Ferroplasma sp.]MCL4312094.1 MFS transporter [Candidatus Thermoplasmatota archaeon]
MDKNESEITTDLLPRLDRLPWSSWHWKVWFILAGGMLLEGFVLSIGGSTLSTVEKLFSLTKVEVIALTPIFLVGEMLGGIYLGAMADIRGRKELFIITMAIIAAGSLLSAISVNYIMLAASRAIAGFGIGGELGSAITALEEFSPSKNRGFSVGTGNGVMFDFGTFIAGFVSFFAIAYLPVSYGWRIAFLTAVVLAAFIFVARLDLPESIRYLLRKGKVDEAGLIVAGIELKVEKKTGKLSPVKNSVKVMTDSGNIGASEGFRVIFKKYKKRIALSWILNFTETWPYYAAFSIIPLIFTDIYHIKSQDTGLILSVVLGAGVVGVLIWAFLLDIIGRRPVILITYIMAGIVSIILGIVVKSIDFVVFIAILSLMYFFTYAAAALLYPQIGEMFPTRARGSGVGTAIGFGRLGGIIGPFVLLALLPLGLIYVFVVTGIVLIIGGLAEVVLGPELKRESLEKASNDD